MKHHILVVDDDEMIQAMVSFLAKENPNVPFLKATRLICWYLI